MSFDYYAPVLHLPESQYFNCSGLVNRYSMQAELVDREGNNGGLLRDGTQVKDLLARKLRISWTLNAMTAREFSDLCNALQTMEFATVFDPYASRWRSIVCHVTLPAFDFAFQAPSMPLMMKHGATLILEEA